MSRSTGRPNKELKLTNLEHIGGSQLNSSVLRTVPKSRSRGGARIQLASMLSDWAADIVYAVRQIWNAPLYLASVGWNG